MIDMIDRTNDPLAFLRETPEKLLERFEEMAKDGSGCLYLQDILDSNEYDD